MKKIVLTGGGTAGHVTPNLALVPGLLEKNVDITYIGSKDGIERKLIQAEGLKYYGISSGKLRRYFSMKNFTDPFRVMKGFFEAYRFLGKLKPDVIFSKGGFVVVPVVLAGFLRCIPIVLHESDYTPGLANRIAMPFATKVCTTFKATADAINSKHPTKSKIKSKALWTGTPIRAELLAGDPAKGRRFADLASPKPVLLLTGGSLGAKALNLALREALPDLLAEFDIIHLCGKGNLDTELEGLAGYSQYEYVNKEMADLMAASDIIVGRAGSNTLSEILALKKPNLLIPLPASQSRGDQILNADSFSASGYSAVLPQEHLTKDTLLAAIRHTFENRQVFITAMENCPVANGIEKVLSILMPIIAG